MDIIVMLGLLVILLVSFYYRRYLWNNGVCYCGKGFLVHFDTDSQGGEGYRCSEPKCKHSVWL